MKVQFDKKKAQAVFSVLGDFYQNQKGIFNGVILSQDQWPSPLDPIERANWIFAIALFMRGRAITDDQFQWFWELYQGYPDIFNPAVLAEKWTPQLILEALKSLAPKILRNKPVGKGLGALGQQIEERLAHLYQNFLILQNQWGGNVLNLFEGIRDFEQAFSKADYKQNPFGFWGMRRKIFSLFALWLQDRGLLPDFPAPLPADFHALRILLATGIVKITNAKTLAFNKLYPALEGKRAVKVGDSFVDVVMLWSQKFFAKAGFSPRVIHPAMWILSREMCSLQLQNTTRKKASIFFDEKIVRKNPALWPKNYRDPCSFCPIEEFCAGAVPSAPYYRWGLLVPFKRMEYPYKFQQSALPGLEESMIFRGAKGRKK